MDYKETLNYLYNRLPMFTRIGAAAYKKDLHNTCSLCEVFDRPEKKIKTIHIAGTNGKGSTSHMLAAIFQTAGYKTGLYTSPHLKDFRERIKVNGEMISKQFVTDFTHQSKKHIDEIEPSFFELTVVMAFSYFAHQQVDIAIIETGLGGRIDSTNIITPELSIITNIGWDHMNILGDTLEKIAIEKAGIIKPHTPVVIGETLPETKKIFEEKSAKENADIVFAEELFDIQSSVSHLKFIECIFTDKNTNLPFELKSDLPGIYQQKNIRTVLTAINILREKGYVLPDKLIQSALQEVKIRTGLHGRWELIHENPSVILDVAHNEDGIKQIIHQLSQNNNSATIRIVIGMVKDKEVDRVLALFPKNYHFYFTNAHLPRALPAEDLQSKANELGLRGKTYDDVNNAIREAVQDAVPEDIIVVCGSVFVIGEVEVITH